MLVYRITCRTTGKSYIGVTRQKLSVRLAHHRACIHGQGMRRMRPLSIAIREYGWADFDVDVLAHAKTAEEMYDMERAAIQLYRTQIPNGYNYSIGGGLDYSGKAPWNRGVPLREDTKRKLSDARTGGKNYRARPIEMNGVRYDCIEDACEALSLTRGQMNRRLALGLATYLTVGVAGNYGRQNRASISAETRRKMSAAHSGAKHYRARRIMVNGVEYPSIKDAEGVSGFTRMQLRLMLKQGTARYLSESQYIVPRPVTVTEPVFEKSTETRARMSEKKRAWWAGLSPEDKRAHTEQMHPHLREKE